MIVSRIISEITELPYCFSYFRPYSPDLNPIEEAFGCAKQWLQRNPEICMKYPKWCFEMALEQVSTVIIVNYTLAPKVMIISKERGRFG